MQKIRKGYNSVRTCDRVMVLALYTSADDLQSLYQVLFNFPLNFLRYAPDKLNIAKTRKGSNSMNTSDRVTVLAFCNYPHDPVSCIKFHLKTFYRYAPDKLIIAKL